MPVFPLPKRASEGWDSVALLIVNRCTVQGDLVAASMSWPASGCRQTRRRNTPTLGEASQLRPDRSGHN